MNILEYAKNISEYNMRHKKTLAHGMEWKKHKYIRKEGDRYIYPEDVVKGADRVSKLNKAADKLKIQKKQAETYKKNAAAAQYNKDYNAIKEEMKSYDANPSQKTFDKVSSMMVKNPMAGSQVMDLEPYDKPTQKEATDHVNKSIAREADYMGWKTNSDNVQKNADASKYGGDASRYANSNGAKLKIQKQLEESRKKNADAAKYGGDAARYAYKPETKSTAKPVDTKEYIAKQATTTYANGLSTLNKMLDEYKRKYDNKELTDSYESTKERNKIRDYANNVLTELDKLDPYKAIDFTREAKSRISSISKYDKRYSGIGAGVGSDYDATKEKKNSVQKNADASKYGGDAARYAKKSDAKTTSKSEPEVSDEYKQDLEYNSKKNVYFGKQSKPTVSGSNSVTTWDNANVKSWDDAESEYEKEKKYNSQKNRW